MAFFFALANILVPVYTTNAFQNIPAYTRVNNVMVWNFKQGLYDWNYPNSLDCTLYSKKQVIKDLFSLHFFSPNSLEGAWASRGTQYSKGACYIHSKVVNIPLNIVQETHANRAMKLSLLLKNC